MVEPAAGELDDALGSTVELAANEFAAVVRGARWDLSPNADFARVNQFDRAAAATATPPTDTESPAVASSGLRSAPQTAFASQSHTASRRPAISTSNNTIPNTIRGISSETVRDERGGF